MTNFKMGSMLLSLRVKKTYMIAEGLFETFLFCSENLRDLLKLLNLGQFLNYKNVLFSQMGQNFARS